MHSMGIFTGGQLRNCSRLRLTQIFGKMGNVYYDFARGTDHRKVEAEHIRKSVGCERTFMKDLDSRSPLVIELYNLVLELVERIEKDRFKGLTLTLKVKFHDFTQITKSQTLPKPFTHKDDILPVAKRLLSETDFPHHPIRLLGLSVSHSQDDEPNAQPHWVQLYLPFKDR